MEGEPAENQAERKAKERPLVTLTEVTIITSMCVNFRSSAAKPGSNPASALICSVTSVPYLETGLIRRPHHQSVDKLRSRALALSTGAACLKVPKTWQFPYPLLSLSREEKKWPLVRIKNWGTYGL